MSRPTVEQTAERPTGFMPRYTQYIVIGAIAILILMATFWSGGKPQKVESRAPVVGPTPNQLQSFQQTLERERRETELQAGKQREQLRQAQIAQALAATPVNPAPPVPDPVAELNGKRQAAAPFASSYVVQAPPQKALETPALDLASQVVVRSAPPQLPVGGGPPSETKGIEIKPGAPKPNTTDPKESGRQLPPQEGSLFRIYEGTLIHAALTNRLDGSFAGPVNCIVSTPVLAQDQRTVLIPVNARFLGKAERVDAENQTRLAVTFKRLILPNGYSVDLEAAPGLDSGGETGLKGKVENHNLRKFGLSGAIGLLGGLALYGTGGNPYAAGVANASGSSGANILGHALNAVPTITVPEGHSVKIYLPGDLLIPAYPSQTK